jgi:hypothetical protein
MLLTDFQRRVLGVIGRWLAAIEEADWFVDSRPRDEISCRYSAPGRDGFGHQSATRQDWWLRPHAAQATFHDRNASHGGTTG